VPPAPPTVRDVTNWLTRRPDSLIGGERPRLKAILDRCPELQAASGQVRAFAAMLTELTGQDLPQWTAAARSEGLPGIASFAKGLEQDLDAVTRGLTMTWSSGPVEGRVNHQDGQTADVRPGRLPLLRKRVLLTAKT
jgi:transposase